MQDFWYILVDKKLADFIGTVVWLYLTSAFSIDRLPRSFITLGFGYLYEKFSNGDKYFHLINSFSD